MSREPTGPRRFVAGGAERAGERSAAELLARIPRSDPDYVARERIWREMARTLPSPRPKRIRFLLPVAVAATAAIAIVLLTRVGAAPVSTATLELAAGNVLAAAPKHDWVQALAGASLPEDSRLHTDEAARAVVALSRSAIVVDPGTELGLAAFGGKTVLRLSGGEIVAEVEHLGKGDSFVVQTPRYRVAVKGTIFSVRERADDDVSVTVSRGVVEVTGAEGKWEVAAGYAWNSKPTPGHHSVGISSRDLQLLELTLADGPRAPIRVEGESLDVSENGVGLGPTPVSWNAPVNRYHFVGTSGAGQAEADTITSAGSSATVTLTLPQEASKTSSEMTTPPLPTAQMTQAEEQSSRPEASRRRRGSGSVERELVAPASPASRSSVGHHGPHSGGIALQSQSTVAPAPVSPPILARLDPPAKVESLSPPTSEAGTVPPPPVVLAADPYAKAVALSRSGRYAEAADALTAIADAHGAHADLALYDLARLRKRYLRDPTGALDALLRYEQEYPKGALAQEVELSAIELELEGSDLTASLAQMNRFLEAHPDSERAPEVHLLRGNVFRRRGDCESALREYRQAPGDGLGDDSLYYTAFCQQALGRSDDAVDSLRHYVDRYPHGRHAVEARSALQGRGE